MNKRNIAKSYEIPINLLVEPRAFLSKKRIDTPAMINMARIEGMYMTSIRNSFSGLTFVLMIMFIPMLQEFYFMRNLMLNNVVQMNYTIFLKILKNFQ